FALVAYGIEISFQHAVDCTAILQCRADLTGDSPLARQFELQWAGLIGLNRGSAQPTRQFFNRRQAQPWRHPRMSMSRIATGKKIGLKLTWLALAEPRTQSLVFDQLSKVARRSLINLARTLFGIHGERVTRSRHPNIEKTPFLLPE